MFSGMASSEAAKMFVPPPHLIAVNTTIREGNLYIYIYIYIAFFGDFFWLKKAQHYNVTKLFFAFVLS